MKEDEASSTAYTVVHGILHTAQNPQLSYLLNDEIIEANTKILSATSQGRQRLLELHHPLKRYILPFLEWLLLPGITLNYVLRKKYIEEQVVRVIEEGVTQVVNIGAGFDTLAMRLSKHYPSITFIEIDHPATSKHKVEALGDEAGATNLYFSEADLSQTSLQEALKGCDGFDSNKKTLYISEGVLMYLSEADVSKVFDSIRALSGEEALFIFSAMEPNWSKKNNVRVLLHLYLKLKKESYLWYIPDTKISEFVDRQGFTIIDMADTEYYRENYLHEDYTKTLHKGEYVVMTKVGKDEI